MIVDAPLNYKATIRRARARNPTQAVYRATTPVELVEWAAIDAPVALRYRNPFSDVCPEADGKEVVLRYADDSLWKLEFDAETVLDGFASRERSQHPLFCTKQLDYIHPKYSMDEDPDIVQVYNTDLIEIEDMARAKGKHYALIDGQIWKNTVEPNIVMHSRSAWNSYAIITSDAYHVDLERKYRLDDFDGAIEDFRIDVSQMAMAPPKIEVIIPEAIRSDVDSKYLFKVANELKRSMTRRVVDETREFFDAYAELRDRLANKDENNIVENIKSLMDAVNYAANVHGFEADDVMGAHLRRALRRIGRTVARDDVELDGLFTL